MALADHQGLTIEDLEAMSPNEQPDGRRYELIGGSIVVNGSPVLLGDGGTYETVADSVEHVEADAPVPVPVPTSLASLFEL